MRPDTGTPFYIGKGNSMRRFQHIWNVRARIKRGMATKKDEAIAFFLDAGFEIPIVLVRENITNHEAVATEIALIDALGRWPDGPLLNKTGGGGGLRLFKHAVSTRVKIGNGNRGQKRSPDQVARIIASQTGKKLSKEHKIKVGISGRGRKRTPQQCANIAAALAGKPKSPEHVAKIRAYKHTEESKQKMKAAKVGWQAHPNFTTKGYFHIHDGISTTKFVPAGTPIPEGWVRGRYNGDGRLNLSPEAVARRSVAQRGKKRSIETRQRISAALKGKPKGRRSASNGKQTSLFE